MVAKIEKILPGVPQTRALHIFLTGLLTGGVIQRSSVRYRSAIPFLTHCRTLWKPETRHEYFLKSI